MQNNMHSNRVFNRVWSSVYKIIGGETKFKDNFKFIEGTEETSRREDGKITIQFVFSILLKKKNIEYNWQKNDRKDN